LVSNIKLIYALLIWIQKILKNI